MTYPILKSHSNLSFQSQVDQNPKLVLQLPHKKSMIWCFVPSFCRSWRNDNWYPKTLDETMMLRTTIMSGVFHPTTIFHLQPLTHIFHQIPLRFTLPQTPILSIKSPHSLSSSSTTLAQFSNHQLFDLNHSYLSCSMPNTNRPLKVAVLLSGGVDSSVALRLLHAAGHSCTAFYLKIWFQVLLFIALYFTCTCHLFRFLIALSGSYVTHSNFVVASK